MKTNGFKLISIAVLAWGLSACGGGGDDSTTTSSTAAYPVGAVYTRELSTSASYTVSAKDTAGTYYVTVSDTPRGDTIFEGITRNTYLSTFTMKMGDALMSTSSSLFYYGLNPPRVYGSLDSSGEYTVTTATGVVPVTAKVGETWSGFTGTIYRDSSKSTVLRNITRNYSLEADTATTAYMCANTILSGTSTTSSNCLKIDTAGNVLGHRVTLAVNGQIITFR